MIVDEIPTCCTGVFFFRGSITFEEDYRRIARMSILQTPFDDFENKRLGIFSIPVDMSRKDAVPDIKFLVETMGYVVLAETKTLTLLSVDRETHNQRFANFKRNLSRRDLSK